MARTTKQELALPRLYQRGRFWAADLRQLGGKRTSLRDPKAPGWPARGPRTTNEKTAGEWLVDYARALRQGVLARELGTKPTWTLSVAVENYLAAAEDRLNERTIELDRVVTGHLLRRFGETKVVADIDTEALQVWFRELKRDGYARSTRQTMRQRVGVLFNWLEIEPNPVRKVELGVLDAGAQAHVRIWNDEEVEKLRNAADELDELLSVDPERAATQCSYRLALELGLATGARRNELFCLRWEDFNAAGNARNIRIHQQLHARFHGTRFIPLKGSKKTAKERFTFVLPGWWQGFHLPQARGFVLARPDGNPCTPDVRQRMVVELLDKAGLRAPFVGWHSLRHRYSLEVMQLFGRIDWLSRWLGHTSVQITEQAYSHLKAQDACEAAARLLYQGKAATVALRAV